MVYDWKTVILLGISWTKGFFPQSYEGAQPVPFMTYEYNPDAIIEK